MCWNLGGRRIRAKPHLEVWVHAFSFVFGCLLCVSTIGSLDVRSIAVLIENQDFVCFGA